MSFMDWMRIVKCKGVCNKKLGILRSFGLRMEIMEIIDFVIYFLFCIIVI